MKNLAEQLQFDQNHVWHPYASLPAKTQSIIIAKTKGSIITTAKGQELVDGMSSWWATIHGYNHPTILKAMHQQLDTMPHIMFGGLTHQPAIELSKRLIELTPAKLTKVFLSDSGSVAMEVAIKMAMQYWKALNQPNKHKLITVRNGYHGDTFATMAICDPINGMHNLFKEQLVQHYFAPAPQQGFKLEQAHDEDIVTVEQLLKQHHKSIAAFTIEPIVQGAGGMRFYRPDYLSQIRQLCDQYNVLLIVDEIATGFGRTGKLFASEWADIQPDIMTLGKTLTGGHISLAATLTSNKIAGVISNPLDSKLPNILAHGPTFMANPLACSAAIANIDLLLSTDWQQNIKRIETHFSKHLSPLKNLEWVADVRVLGAIGVVELAQEGYAQQVQDIAVANNVWIRPFGKLVYSMPAYNITTKDLTTLSTGIVKAVKTLKSPGVG
ncbi:MAG TPA: adenosylmethionine--8-amino-7-oxononanoate transaminase [Thiomicrospira sp.]|nr:adenosylmethionine--8-amino-7-oxononanoate transaminase [Thiomicrospira sp.]